MNEASAPYGRKADIMDCAMIILALLYIIFCHFKVSASDLKVIEKNKNSEPFSFAKLLEKYDDWYVDLDKAGNPVVVRIPINELNDYNMEIVCRWDSIREITILGHSHSPIPLAAINRLSLMTNLTTLRLVCFVEITEGEIIKISEMSKLRHLILVGTDAPPHGYRYLSIMTNLNELVIKHSKNFSDEHLAGLATLPGLKKIEVMSTSLSTNSINLLSGFGSVTNASLRSTNWHKYWTNRIGVAKTN